MVYSTLTMVGFLVLIIVVFFVLCFHLSRLHVSELIQNVLPNVTQNHLQNFILFNLSETGHTWPGVTKNKSGCKEIAVIPEWSTPP